MVGRLDPGLGIGQHAGHIALVFVVAGRALDRGQVLTPAIAGEVGRHRPHRAVGGRLLPVHLDGLDCTLGVPPAFGHHRHGAW
ncbi:hypothetical protein D9M71_655790 [compost metagenome]